MDPDPDPSSPRNVRFSEDWCDEDEKLAVSLVYNYVYYVYDDDDDDDDDEKPRDGIG